MTKANNKPEKSRIYYAHLFADEAGQGGGFGLLRWHTLNYLLRIGEIINRSPLEAGRRRPLEQESEWALIYNEDTFYFFNVERRELYANRFIDIIVGNSDPNNLQNKVQDLMQHGYGVLKLTFDSYADILKSTK